MYASVQFKLQLNSPDRKKLSELMRKQSSAIYIDSAIYKAKQYPTDKKVIFGSKALLPYFWRGLQQRLFLPEANACGRDLE